MEKGDCLSQNSSAGTPMGLYTQFTCVYIVFTVFFTPRPCDPKM